MTPPAATPWYSRYAVRPAAVPLSANSDLELISSDTTHGGSFLHSENQIPTISIRVTTSRDQASAGLKLILTKARGILSGTTIRGTLIEGPNRPQNANTIRQSGPRRPNPLQTPKRPSPHSAYGPALRYGPSEAPRTRGVIFASLETSPPRPSTTHRISASLEGSRLTLGRAD